VNHGLKRLVCIGEDGIITLAAIRWLSGIGASFVMLDRLGKVRVVTGPASASEARLRRAQALALSNGTAVPIARDIIVAKLQGQESVLRDRLKNDAKANVIATLRERLFTAESIDAIRTIESVAAFEYWKVFYDVPVRFPCNDKRVPSHWLRFGARHSPLTGGPRLAINPANSLLNYLSAIAASECRLACICCALDPALGFIHKDTANRDSLALDLLETIRAAIEGWLVDWLLTEPLQSLGLY
jgi:CRISPR-associated protein Cas1